MEIKVSDNLKRLAELCDGKLYIVGGYVRNALLNIPCFDIDICSPLGSNVVEKICIDAGYKVKRVNEKLGTLLITIGDEQYEYTPFRRENYVRGNHSPESVEFVDDIMVDARRRDFTCNAIYFNISTGKIFDPYNGAGDIQNKVVKCIETPLFVFSSDGLRILRLVRFACELGFKIDAKTFKTACEMVYQLDCISPERKYAELKKIVLSEFKYGAQKNDFLIYFNGLKLYKYLFGNLNEGFQISIKSDDYKKFLKSPKESKFIAFLILYFVNKYEFKYMQEGQINCDVMMLSNVLRLPRDLACNLTRAYLVFQQIRFKPLNELVAINYHNLTDVQRSAVNVFCDVKPVSEKVLELKLGGVPLNISQLQITAEEIATFVPQNKISQIQKLLFDMCLMGKVKNENAELKKVLATIKTSK